MIRTVGDGGINWNWYLCADFNGKDMTAHIFYYDRWHKYEDRGSNHPKAEWLNGGRINLVEDEKRTVHQIKLDGVVYQVTNPAYVFSYHNMTHYVSK